MPYGLKQNLEVELKSDDVVMEAAKLSAATAAQRMASALNSINATASLGYNANISEGATCSESHSYAEKCDVTCLK